MAPVTGFFAAILALLFVGLSFYVVRQRQAIKVGLGDGGNDELKRRIRAQGNFAEYVPLALILLALAESGGASKFLVGLLAVALIAGRAVHAYSLLVAEAKDPEKYQLRVVGMMATFGVLGISALLNLF